MPALNSRALLLAALLPFVPDHTASTSALRVADTFASQRMPWTVARPVPSPILLGEGVVSTADDDMDATFTANGRTLYFARAHFPNRLGVILETHFVDGKWTTPRVDRVPENPWTYRQLQSALHSTANGWGNVYQVDMSMLRSSST